MNDQKLYALAVELGQRLKTENLIMTTAESCTGGWVAKCLTDVPGSSAWFEHGWVTYSNEAKTALIDVPASVLETYGAVSAEVVIAMAEGALRHSSANVSVAISGVAGPDGGTKEKPVGTVWFAWAVRHDQPIRSETRLEYFQGDRDAVRRQAVATAMEGSIRLITSSAQQ